MSTFITELPADKHGNRAYTNRQAAVIEVEAIDEYIWRVIAPDSFRSRWMTLGRKAIWKEVSGPARLLSEDEYQLLIGSKPQ